MSAEVLRRAADLMRERAEAACSYPKLRWVAEQAQVPEGWTTTLVGIPETEESVFEDRHCSLADAEYIASWHPAVALAVADWLEAVATAFGLPVPPGLPSDKGEVWTSSASAWAMPGSVVSAALAVARAYLGESA